MPRAASKKPGDPPAQVGTRQSARLRATVPPAPPVHVPPPPSVQPSRRRSTRPTPNQDPSAASEIIESVGPRRSTRLGSKRKAADIELEQTPSTQSKRTTRAVKAKPLAKSNDSKKNLNTKKQPAKKKEKARQDQQSSKKRKIRGEDDDDEDVFADVKIVPAMNKRPRQQAVATTVEAPVLDQVQMAEPDANSLPLPIPGQQYPCIWSDSPLSSPTNSPQQAPLLLDPVLEAAPIDPLPPINNDLQAAESVPLTQALTHALEPQDLGELAPSALGMGTSPLELPNEQNQAPVPEIDPVEDPVLAAQVLAWLEALQAVPPLPPSSTSSNDGFGNQPQAPVAGPLLPPVPPEHNLLSPHQMLYGPDHPYPFGYAENPPPPPPPPIDGFNQDPGAIDWAATPYIALPNLPFPPGEGHRTRKRSEAFEDEDEDEEPHKRRRVEGDAESAEDMEVEEIVPRGRNQAVAEDRHFHARRRIGRTENQVIRDAHVEAERNQQLTVDFNRKMAIARVRSPLTLSSAPVDPRVTPPPRPGRAQRLSPASLMEANRTLDHIHRHFYARERPLPPPKKTRSLTFREQLLLCQMLIRHGR